MLDFSELPQDGIKFEQLIREMLMRTGLEVHWTGVGPDGGRDLVATERVEGPLGPFSRKWLVSCKHKAHGSTSVVMDDIRDITDACGAVGAAGFLLACSTQPASSVVKRLEELEQRGPLQTRFWDGIEIERRLNVPDLFALIHQFFPNSATSRPWLINNAGMPSFWAANYKDYVIYLCSRIAHSFPELKEVEHIVSLIEQIKLPGGSWDSHYLRLRAVYFDDKHEQFSVFVDYLYPRKRVKDVVPPHELDAVFRSGQGLHEKDGMMWYITHWDVLYVEANTVSDRFHPDAKEYYEDYMANFRIGNSREGWVDEIEAPNPNVIHIDEL